MSLLGVDIGTSGCKSVVFSQNGQKLSQSYREYNIISSKPGYAELDSINVWNKIRETIKEVALQTKSDPIQSISVSSMGEAMVPVSKEREILSNSILGNDLRGNEFIRSFLKKNISGKSLPDKWKYSGGIL